MLKRGYISILELEEGKPEIQIVYGDPGKIKAAIPSEIEYRGKKHTVYKRRKLYSINAYDCLGYAYPVKVPTRGGEMIVTRVIRGDMLLDGGIKWERHEDGNPIQAGRCDVILGLDGNVYELGLDLETLEYSYSMAENQKDLFSKVGHPYGLCYFVSHNDEFYYGQYDHKNKVVQWTPALLIK